jgi:4-nitrophenyl phosphatase
MPGTQINALILDMDGVLWRDSQPIGDLPAIFSGIRQRGWKVTLATNNATLSIEQFLDKLEQFGVSLSNQNIVNSSQAAGHYLAVYHPGGGKVFIIGETGLFETLKEYGFQHADEGVLAVVVGLDRQLTYDKLMKASLLIQSGAPFIGTNPDRTLPTPQGLIPGAGVILAALETATGVKPLIVGKPSPEMYKVAMERMGSLPEQTLVVGDRLDTDIAGAKAIGCPVALVLSGVTSLEASKQCDSPPDWIAPDLTTLLEQI